MSRFEGCPDRLTCLPHCPGGPGIVRLLSGGQVLKQDAFCSVTHPGIDGAKAHLAATAKLRHICDEEAYYAAKQGKSVVLEAELPNGQTASLDIYRPPASNE